MLPSCCFAVAGRVADLSPDLPGRNCAPNPLQKGPNAGRCCIPCPVYDYLYDDDFKALTDGAAWANVAGFVLCVFLLISMVVLPVKVTRRSYLNIILLGGILCLELGFIIPLAAQPDQCYNGITPNDMFSSNVCAVSGAFAAFGGMALVTWSKSLSRFGSIASSRLHRRRPLDIADHVQFLSELFSCTFRSAGTSLPAST